MLGLPDEILLNIFSESEPFNVLPFRRVCKRWRIVIDTSTTLQLQIECLLDGRDFPAPGSSSAGELQKIRQSNLAWETLTPTKQSSFKVSDVKGSHLLFHNGLVGLLDKSGGNLEMWEYHDGTGFQSVAKHTHIGSHLVHYAFDRAQDVLVLVEKWQGIVTLHIRKLSTDGRHQGAAKAAISFECHGGEKPVRTEIHGDYIAILIRWSTIEIGDNYFFLVDWKEGKILVGYMDRVCSFCFIDVRTILLAVALEDAWQCLQAIFLPLDEADVPSLFLDLPSLENAHRHYALDFKTDEGRLIGLRVGIERVVPFGGNLDSDSDYILVIDRPGLLKLLAEAKQEGKWPLEWTEWESGITTIVPLGDDSYKMAWAVFGRRIVINAEAETLPFAKSAVEVVADGNQAEADGHKNDEGQGSEDQEDPNNGERLIVLDFGCHRLASTVEAGDASGNIIRSRTQGGGELLGVLDISSDELPYHIWMERVPSCVSSRFPSALVHMSESMVLVVEQGNDELISIRSIRVF